MGKQVHKIVTPAGEVYRVWSDNSDTYVSDTMTLAQLELFSKLMDFEQILTDMFYDNGALDGMKFKQWVSRGEVREAWEEEIEYPPTSSAEYQRHATIAKNAADFLRKTAEIWENFYLKREVPEA